MPAEPAEEPGMRRAWTVVALFALVVGGVGLAGCKCLCGDSGGASATACADCKAAGGMCAKCAEASKAK